MEISAIRNSIGEDRLIHKLNDLEQKVESVLTRTANTLINFTDHSLNHSKGVENAYSIIFNNDFSTLTDYEKYFLIAATLLHDIGMVGNKEDFKYSDYEGMRRNAHQHFSKDIIISNQLSLNLDNTEANLIAKIAEAHRKVPLDSLEDGVSYNINGNVRIKLLAALLRFADELHITKDRTSFMLTQILNPDEESLLHHKTHTAISGVSNIGNGIIRISAVADTKILESSLNNLYGEINSKFNSVKPILDLNNINLNSIQLQLSADKVILNELFLIIADNSFTISELKQALAHREVIIIDKLLSEVNLRNLISTDVEGKISLNAEEDTFKTIFNSLKDDNLLDNFIKTDYVNKNIGDIYDSVAYNFYGFRHLNGDREDRILLAKSSPIILDSILNKRDIDPNFAQMDRSVILDLLILNGFMQDVTRNPELLSNAEMKFAMQTITNNLYLNMGPFLSLVEGLHPKNQAIAKKQFEQTIEKKNS